MINGRYFRQALDKFFMSPVSGNARVQVQLPNGQMMDIKEINLLENRIVGDSETHRLVLVAEPERASMNKIIGKL
jgi:hypothetical protein|tara:strand:+ start:837 stop:1061 length:225 start_codon:yes stop_codon:yes gene_type:complete